MPIKISVITASYNNIATISDAYNSLREQTYSDIERIWIDGASSDGTKELLESLYNSNNGIFISEPDKGIYNALNKGIKLATGDIVGFLHADDIFNDKYCIERIAKIFSDPEVQAVYGDLVYVKKDSPSEVVRRWKSKKFYRSLLKSGWMPPHPTLYIRREIYQNLGGFDENYKISSDYDFILKLFLIPNLKIIYLPTTLVKMRVGGTSNRSILNIFNKSREDFQAIKSNNVGGIRTLILKNISKFHQFW